MTDAGFQTQTLHQLELRRDAQPRKLKTHKLTLHRYRQAVKGRSSAFLKVLPSCLVGKRCFFAHNFHRPQHHWPNRRLKASSQQRQQFASHPITEDVHGLVGGIRAEFDLLGTRELKEFFFGPVEQWPNQGHRRISRRGAPPLHPGQSAPRATQQPQEEKLNLIIRVVSQSNHAHAHLLRRASQELMPQLARGHFH